MKNHLYLAIILSIFSGCSSSSSTDSAEVNILNQLSGNDLWQYQLNHGLDSIELMYTKNAIKISEDGSLFKGDSSISSHYRTNQSRIDSIYTIQLIQANDIYDYEIGSYEVTGGKEFVHLLIWKNKDSIQRRELEFIAEKQENAILPDEIDSLRTLWMKLSNAHQPGELVKATYHESALYYNHRPLIIGTEDIANTYGYMNNPNYQLSLDPLIIEPANESLVFEIGQCSGSYNGKYILVWQKNESGQWKILLDSNI